MKEDIDPVVEFLGAPLDPDKMKYVRWCLTEGQPFPRVQVAPTPNGPWEFLARRPGDR